MASSVDECLSLECTGAGRCNEVRPHLSLGYLVAMIEEQDAAGLDALKELWTAEVLQAPTLQMTTKRKEVRTR
jgi:hypothetical protein